MRVYTLNNSQRPGPTREARDVDRRQRARQRSAGWRGVLYPAWYLLENYGREPARDRARRTQRTFYLLPTVNPDGRAAWFRDAHDASSSRTGRKPTDDDGDGLCTTRTARRPRRRRLDRADAQAPARRRHAPPRPRRSAPAHARARQRTGIKGDWIMLGSEGIDNDGDGRINEDDVGGYDMNRAWPSRLGTRARPGRRGPLSAVLAGDALHRELRARAPNIAARAELPQRRRHDPARPRHAEAFGEYPREDVACTTRSAATASACCPSTATW
jgi:hypothetical protein